MLLSRPSRRPVNRCSTSKLVIQVNENLLHAHVHVPQSNFPLGMGSVPANKDTKPI